MFERKRPDCVVYPGTGLCSVFSFYTDSQSDTSPGYLMLRHDIGMRREMWEDLNSDGIADSHLQIMIDGEKYVIDQSGKSEVLLSDYLVSALSSEGDPFGSKTGVSVPSINNDGKVMIIPDGVVAIYGGAGTGKSSFAFRLSRLIESSKFISFGEPDLISISDMSALARVLNTSFFKEDKRVVILDSARSFLFAPSRSTGAGGVNNELFIMFSKISSSLAKLGKCLIVTFNPMNVDKDQLRDTLEGSLSGLITINQLRDIMFTSRLNNDRKTQFFSLDDREKSSKGESDETYVENMISTSKKSTLKASSNGAMSKLLSFLKD